MADRLPDDLEDLPTDLEDVAPVAVASPAPEPAQTATKPEPTLAERFRRYADATAVGGLPLTIAGDVLDFDPANAMRLYAQGMSRNFLGEGVGAMESGLAQRYLTAASTGALPLVAGVDAFGGDADQKARIREYEAAKAREDALVAGAREDLGPAGSFLMEAAGGMWGPRALRRPGLAAGVEGAVGGAGAAESMGDVPRTAALGGSLGAASQVAGEYLGKGVKKVLGSPLVQESAAARYLRSKGVDALTVGQSNPEGILNQIEDASTSTAIVGPGIKGQRAAAQNQWVGAMLDEARPPGMTRSNRTAEVSEQLDQMYQGFQSAYAPAHNIQMLPITSSGASLRPSPGGQSAMDQVVNDPNVLATAEQRKVVQRFLANQMSLLPPQVGPVNSDVLLSIRSNIRDQARKSLKGENYEMAELLENADVVLTDTLEHQLTPGALQALRAADAAYAKYKVVEKAVAKAGDQLSGVTPAKLSAAVKSSLSEGAFARGDGGELRELAKAGIDVFREAPHTGARLLATGGVAAPFSYASNLSGPRAFLRGTTGFQRGVSAASEYGGQAAASAMRSAVTPENAKAANLSTTEWLNMATEQNPESLGPYAETLARAKADGRLAMVHYVLEQKDPQYREMLAAARAGGVQ